MYIWILFKGGLPFGQDIVVYLSLHKAGGTQQHLGKVGVEVGLDWFVV